MPPRMATAKALMPNSVPMVEEMVNSGATRMPAMPASNPDSANASVDHALDADAHQPRGIRVLHHREQRLAVTRCAAKKSLQAGGEREADHRDEHLQIAGLRTPAIVDRCRSSASLAACRAGPCRR